MLWKITCYNGTIWEANAQLDLDEALRRFYRDTSLTQWDIKLIENLH